MPKIVLTPTERKAFRSDAHHLDPVVLIGNDGLSESVQKEIDAALNAHSLIKIRVFSDDRDQREAILLQLAESLAAAPIQHIGKLLVLWRPKPVAESARDEKRKPGPKNIKVLMYSKRGGQRPEAKTLKVLGNQRLTAGGKVKRAKPRMLSTKKLYQS
jgi:putative YhbY family RNA-binding protein